ncbi:MAG: hypothetical protein WC732_08570 [Candidatus Omnitrophota bacterium]
MHGYVIAVAIATFAVVRVTLFDDAKTGAVIIIATLACFFAVLGERDLADRNLPG